MSTQASTSEIVPGQLVTVFVGRDRYVGMVKRNDPDVGLTITEDGITISGWSWNIIDRVESGR